MDSKLILTFLLFATCQGLPTEMVCCETKNVGDFEYILITEGEVPPACTTGCIYQREDIENSRYCFAPGNLPVTCKDTTSEALNSCSCEETTPDSPKRIFGGVDQTEAKWQVALVATVFPEIELPDDIFCGGSLITPKIVVTAAHCMFYENGTQLPYDAFQALLDLVNVTNLANVVLKTVLDVEVNPNYNPATKKADIALIKIEDVESRILPICLPPPTDDKYSGLCGKTTGWGLVEQSPEEVQPLILQGLANGLNGPIKIMTNSECRSAWFNIITIPYYFVCFADQIDEGTCNGDSGGPLTIRQRRNNALIDILVGVTSFGDADCRLAFPSVFIRVTSYLQWIKNTIILLNGGQQPAYCDLPRESDTCVCC